MKKVTIVFAGGLQLGLSMTPYEAFALERGVRTGEGIVRGADSDDNEVTVGCRHVLYYGVEEVEEKTEEDGCNS